MWLFQKKKPEFFLCASDGFLLIHLRLGKRLFPNSMKCVLNEDEREILIGDICVGNQDIYLRHTNKGYGTQMMQLLLDYAREHEYSTIKGWLAHFDGDSPEDPEHRARQIHFYQKFGFEFIPNLEEPDYTIILRL